MKPELGAESNCAVGSEPDLRSGDPGRAESDSLDSVDGCYLPRARPAETDGFAVYTRRKKLKSRNEGGIGVWEKSQSNPGSVTEVAAPVRSNGEITVRGSVAGKLDGVEVDLGVSGFSDGVDERQRKTVEDRTAEVVAGRNERKSEESATENGNSGETREPAGLEGGRKTVSGSPKTKKMEMKMSKKILVKGGPTTVRELFETRLVDGYPVFYNGGKRGFPLRGIIQESGILCSCSYCKGERVVPPCQFEIHACKSYRRASQYICFENGKSLLDVVKECRKSSSKSLEETIQNFVGPMPVKESVVCRNCNGSFLATSISKMERLCDTCMVSMNSEVDAEGMKSRPLEPLLGITIPENGEVPNTPPQKGRRGRKKRKHSELNTSTRSPTASSPLSKRKKRKWKITDLVSQPAAVPKLPGNEILYQRAFLQDALKKTTAKILKLPDNTSASKTSNGESPSISLQSRSSLMLSSAMITKRDQKLHKLVFESGGLPDGTEVFYYSRGKKLRDGYKLGSGIMCYCCNSLVTPSQFEAHAGWAARRKPFMYIYTSDGHSLHEFAKSLVKHRKNPLKKRKTSNSVCCICTDGGKLVFCDSCPRAFHKECTPLSSFTRGKWYCTYCQNRFPEQITNRCTRIPKNPGEEEIIACVICRCFDFSKSGFGPRTVVLCDQCEKEFHVGCLKKHKIADLKKLPDGPWFCSNNCKCIHSNLQDMLSSRAPDLLPDSSLGIIERKLVQNGVLIDSGFDVRWRLLSAKLASRETRILLSQAVAIFHECFDPIVDPITGRDFIPSMVYGRNIRGQDFSGMYCVMLIVNSSVVSAGILRIFGQEMAELPLAGTLTGYQGKGYFQALFSSIEKLLADLNVKSLVLPSMDTSKSIWINKFGFEEIPEEQLNQYRITRWQIATFKGTRMLQKAIPGQFTTNHNQNGSFISA